MQMHHIIAKYRLDEAHPAEKGTLTEVSDEGVLQVTPTG
jgi:hypothetical protein